MPERIDRTERLLNLVICLMATHAAVSRAEIERQIPGYTASPSPAAFERMFERDKDELRSMGIPVETVTDPSGEVLGYRIPQESYALAGIDFTLDERAAIAIAAQVWSRATIASVPGTALRKLETIVGDEQWSPADVHGDVQLTASDAALLPLMSAIRQNRSVAFSYRAPSEDEARHREVSPWGLRSSQGRWFLIGYDHQRDALRTFRLSRISGTVSVTARARIQEPPDGFDVRSDNRAADADPQATATIRVRGGRAATLRRLAKGAERGADASADARITVAAGSRDALVSLICAAGPDAVALAPDDIVSDVVAGLERIVAAHRGGAQ